MMGSNYPILGDPCPQSTLIKVLGVSLYTKRPPLNLQVSGSSLISIDSEMVPSLTWTLYTICGLVASISVILIWF